MGDSHTPNVLDALAVRQLLLNGFGVRVEPEMIAYLLRRLVQRSPATIPVICGDARTGVPKRILLDPASFGPGASDRRSVDASLATLNAAAPMSPGLRPGRNVP